MQYKIIVDKQSRTDPSTEKKEYTIDIEELHCKGDTYDTLNIEKDKAYVTRRLSLSELHVLTVLEKPVIEVLEGLNIELFEGDNYIYLIDMIGNKFYAEYLIKNEFNELYVTNAQMNSAINQTAQSIELSVNQKLQGYSTTQEMNSAINLKADSIQLGVNQKLENYSTTNQMNSAINLKANEITSSVSQTYETKEGTSSKINTAKAEIKLTTDNINAEVSKKIGDNEVISKINQSAEKVTINANKIELSANDILNLLAGNAINLTSKNILIASTNFNVDKNGNVVANSLQSNNATITGGKIKIKGGSQNNSFLEVVAENENGEKTSLTPSNVYMTTDDGGIFINSLSSQNYRAYLYNDNRDPQLYLFNPNNSTRVKSTEIITPVLTQTSLKSKKKHIKKTKINALELIKNADICEYNLKGEKKETKKHIGLVIGEGYQCPTEVMSEDGQGIEAYSMRSVSWKAIQELLKRVERLEESK